MTYIQQAKLIANYPVMEQREDSNKHIFVLAVLCYLILI